MKGFLAGVAVTILVMAAFPSVGRWVTTLPYRAWSPATISTPAAWHGMVRGERTPGAGRRAMPAVYDD